MRVDLNGTDGSNLSGIHSPERGQTGASQAADLDQSTIEDRTTLTTDDSTVQTLAAKAISSAEVRQDKVEALRQAVQNGSYQIDPGKIAQAMIEDAE